MRHLLALVLTATAASSCSTAALRLTRPVAPEGTFGPVRTLSLEVTTNLGSATRNAIISGLVLGEVPLPIPVDSVVRDQLRARLEGLGYQLCAPAPCGEGAMTVRLTESSVNPQATRSGMEVNVRLDGHFVVRQHDGQVPYDFTFWSRRSGPLERAPQLVQDAAEGMGEVFEKSLLPGRVRVTLPVEEGGPLDQASVLLLSGNLDGALEYLTRLTAEQPRLAGAWYDLGVAWEAKGEWAQARDAYQRAAALDGRRLYVEAAASARDAAP